MAHYAKIDNNNIVQEVLVFGDDIEPGIPSAPLPEGWRWIQTSYNANIRNKFAGKGDTYNEEYDVFLTPKPAPSWTLNTENFGWEPPVPMPEDWDDVYYRWNEETQSWDTLEVNE
jgi:hypothetical protein